MLALKMIERKAMAEMNLSAGTKLAWQAAADLALHEGNAVIEPRHLLFGICSVGRLIVEAENAHRANDLTTSAKSEADRLEALAQEHGLDLALLQRAIRKPSTTYAAHSSDSLPSKSKISRSPATRRVFESAGTDGRVDLLLLLRELLEVHDPKIEQVIEPIRPTISEILGELRPSQSKTAQFIISLDSHLHDLDGSTEGVRSAPRVTDSIDASQTQQPKDASDPMERLALLSELTWEFGTQGHLDAMLQKAVEQLLRIVSSAQRCAILLEDATGSELLLKAHGPRSTVPMISMTSARRAIAERKGFIWIRGEDLTLSQKESDIESGMYVPLVVSQQASGVICLDSWRSRQSFARTDLLFTVSLAHQLALAIANSDLRRTLKQNADVLERLLTNFSPKVRTRLLQRAQIGRLSLGGEKSVVSILCADIRGFSKLAAGLQTEDVVSLLNEYFAALTECIFHNDGTVDKFVGDAILAVFGSPEADPQHCRKAVTAAMEMQRAMVEVSRQRATRGEITCQIGVGIHTGEVLHGFIGSPERMEFTVIGDSVNRAARYCDGAQGSEVLISPEVHQWVWNLVEAEQMTINTKHEGEFLAYRVNRLRPSR
jgi:adenylate cyclase